MSPGNEKGPWDVWWVSREGRSNDGLTKPEYCAPRSSFNNLLYVTLTFDKLYAHRITE